jgi:hypothetical protein
MSTVIRTKKAFDSRKFLKLSVMVLSLILVNFQGSDVAGAGQSSPFSWDHGKLVQEGYVTIRDGEDALVVFPKPYAAAPTLTFKINQVWFKTIPFSRQDFRIAHNEPYSFRIENNHRERQDGAWAVIKWRAEGTRLADKPASSRSKREQVLAMVERLKGHVTEDFRLPGKPITMIDLHHSNVTDSDLALLEDLTSLRSLNLYGTRITDSGLAHLSNLKGLATLQLNSTAIADAGLASLQNLKGLGELGLYGTHITDNGLQYLKGMSNLHKLVLGGSAITDLGLKHLQGLRNLRELVLSKTSVTPEGVAQLQRAVPQLQVVRA